MQKKDCFLVGTVFKLHGYKGDVNIYNEVDIHFDFNALDYFLIEQNNALIPFFIDRVRPTKPNVVLVTEDEETGKLSHWYQYIDEDEPDNHANGFFDNCR